MIRAVGLLAAAAAAMGAWGVLLGGAVLWAGAVAVAAAVVLTWGEAAVRLVGALLLAWPPAALLAAGVPAGLLWPGRWGELAVSLSEGLNRLSALGPGHADGDPWPAAVWLLLAGLLWLAAAGLAVSEPRSVLRSAPAFALVLLPWVVAVAVRQTDEVSWQGAAVVLAVPLWFAPARASAARPVVVLGVVAALASAVLAHAVGPRDQWFAVDEMVDREPQFTTLDTTQTYGPLSGRRTGATMLEVTAPQPALWRMQVLERFGWRGWEVGGDFADQELPEPAARTVDVEVRVRGLRNDMVVSPGRILSLDADGRIGRGAGDGWRVLPMPTSGDTYRLRAETVSVTAETLRAAPPLKPDRRIEDYTRIRQRWGAEWLGSRPGAFGAPPEASDGAESFLRYGWFGEAADLAQSLSSGARTQFEVVERVQRYLTEGGRFRYDTDVERTSRVPLLDFLMRTRAGYCQHFAGAAALLLRLSGVPTRVVAGFATGREQDGRYIVRDADAHAWIEVYFQDIGWVPFNPTPAAADAVVDPSLDPFAPATARGGEGGSALAPGAILGVVLAFGLFITVRRGGRGVPRARRDRVDRLLERLARRAGGPVTPATTLGELRTRSAAFGPHTAGVVALLERERYAPDHGPPLRRPGFRLVRALAADLGAVRAVRVLLGASVRTR
ncbi:transglutaminase-like domain-containing protein [Thermomonospora umbrina]|uniref:Transglutaminase superfamily protein n=1 Tax=Thermomonospora umbrina TaxID=111806 RepID=A0A3D9SSJ7_9ACTN|nr:transglutaminase-like domain-containing protein [Thermomonospora umbrina]REE98946.1 transglutaminase superfamily protein [Thermomonospora umbrina]